MEHVQEASRLVFAYWSGLAGYSETLIALEGCMKKADGIYKTTIGAFYEQIEMKIS